MLAAADCASHYPEQIIYESSWADTTPNGISWLNLLTAEPIPEETEVTDISHTPVRHNSASSCSSSSIGSCYVVLEIQRPRSLTETSSTVGKDDEEDGEEEMEEEMEELHFAQACTNEPEIDCDQLAVSLTIEVPVEYRMFESLEEQTHEIEEHAEASQPVIHESCNEECTEQTRSLGRFTKRTATTPDMSSREQPRPAPSTAGETERSEGCRFTLDTPAPIENNPMAEAKNTVSHSNTSLDSIENKLAPSTPTAPRTTTTTTFSSLSTQRTSVAVPIQRSGPKMGTNTLTRTFAFDRACMEKYGQAPESTLRSIPVAPVTVPAVHKDIGLPPRRSNPSDTSVCAAAAARQSHPAAEPCQANGIDAFEDIPPSPAAFDPQSLGRTSSVLCLMKKCARTVTSEYRLRDAQGNMHAEPTLLQVTYLDGRLPLRTNQTGELFRKTNTLSSSISSRLNKLGLPKMPSTQDLSSASASLGKSYRKRMLSRFRTLLESNGAQPAQPVPWQHKTITELFQERRQRP